MQGNSDLMNLSAQKGSSGKFLLDTSPVPDFPWSFVIPGLIPHIQCRVMLPGSPSEGAVDEDGFCWRSNSQKAPGEAGVSY